MLGNVTSTSVTSPPPESPAAPAAAMSGLSPEEQLLVVMVLADMTKSDAATTSVEVSAEKLEQLREAVRKAAEAAREAKENAGFWGKLSAVLNGDVAMIAQLVAIAAAAVATGGTAAIVLGAIAVGATLGSRYGEELGLPKEVAIGLGVAAAAASVVTGNLGGGLSELSTIGSAMRSTELIAQGTVVAAKAGGAVTGKVSDDCRADAAEHQADARSYQSAQVLEQSTIDENLDRIQRYLDSQGFTVKTGSEMFQRTNQATQLVLQNFGGLA